jgi:hypothetical protein
MAGCLPDGSRVSTHRIGKGSEPEPYHNAVPVQISTVRSPSLYQSRVTFCQTVCGSCKTCSGEGRRLPATLGRPMVCRVRVFRRLMEDCIQPPRRDQGHLLMLCLQTQFQHTVSRIAHQLDLPIGKPTPDQADHLMGPHRDRFVPFAQS